MIATGTSMTKTQNESCFETLLQFVGFLGVLLGICIGITASSLCTASGGSFPRDPIHIQPKFIRCIETNKFRIVLETAGDSFVEQSAYLERSRLALLQYSHETIQRAAGINNILHQQDVFPLEPGLRIVHQVYGSGGDHTIAITRRHEKIDLERASDLPHEIAQEYEASFEQTQHQKIAVRISGGDLSAELGDALRDRSFVEGDSFDGSPGKTWIGIQPKRSDRAGHVRASGPLRSPPAAARQRRNNM